VGVAAVGSVFFSVLAKQATAIAYGEAFASALAVAAGLQAIGIVLAAVLNWKTEHGTRNTERGMWDRGMWNGERRIQDAANGSERNSTLW
jgi:hypothetical protein